MKPRILVWDLSVRLFHWAFAASLSAALLLGFLTDKHSPLFRWHMLAGLIAVFLVALRLLLGIVGSRYARLSRMPIRPRQIVAYFVGAFTGGEARYPGHNPGSALAALAMFALAALLLATGLAAGRDPWEEVHEALAFGLLGVIGAHLAGLAWHALRHRENVVATMVTGRKEGRPEDGLTSAHPAWAVVFVFAVTAWIGGLLARYDAAAARVTLPVTGPTILLGEAGESGEPRVKKRRKHRADHD